MCSPFIKCGENQSSYKLVVLAKYSLATVLFSITYLFAQNSNYIYLIYACDYTLGTVTEYLVFFIFPCSF